MLKDLLLPKNENGTINRILQSVSDGIPTAVFQAPFSQKCRIVSLISGAVLFIVRDGAKAKEYLEEISAMTDKKAVYLPPKDDVLLYKQTFDKQSLYNRLTALYEIGCGAEIIITTFEALLQLFPRKVDVLTLEKGKEYNLNEVISSFISLGYKRVDYCENKASFSVRGDIVEVFPVNGDNIYRVDFFGDEIESIRIFGDSKELNFINFVTAKDITIQESDVEEIEKTLRNCYKKHNGLVSSKKASALYGKLVETLETDLFDDSLEYLAPLLSSSTHNVLEILPKNLTVVYDESKMLDENLVGLMKEHVERAVSLIKAGDGFDFCVNQFSTKEYLLQLLNGKKVLAVQTLTTAIPLINPLKTFALNVVACPRYALNIEDLFYDALSWHTNGYRVVLCAKDSRRAESLYNQLLSKRVPCVLTNEISLNDKGVTVTTDYLPVGFISHDEKLAVIGTNDLFIRQTSKEKSVKKKRNDLFTAPQVGDFAVHEVFGIGLIKGVKRISSTEGSKDYVELEYAGGDRLFVSTDQMDKLSKYLSGTEKPTLNRIGGGEFELSLIHI